MNRYIWIIILLNLWALSVLAQEADTFKFINGKDLSISGQTAFVDSQSFHRISPDYLEKLPANVQEPATNSAGINVTFQMDSKSIRVQWQLNEYNELWNMTPLAVNGLDLYGWNGKEWQFVASAAPWGIKNSVTFANNLDGRLRHYKIYLSLYTELKNIEIGVQETSVIKSANSSRLPEKKVIIYGSSITQGASAARPGMAYPSIVSRRLHIETINLGFSGTGKMEIGMADIIGQLESGLIILDCVPNPSPEQIKRRTVPFVNKIRLQKPDVPIVMMESIFREKDYWDMTLGEKLKFQNSNFRKVYQQLVEEEDTQLYYLSRKELYSSNHSLMVDGTHLTTEGHLQVSERGTN